ncbi:MAG: histidine kinase [Thermaerobacter sp.]|nr:histidine kinase [Thermaerobacter sp.]
MPERIVKVISTAPPAGRLKIFVGAAPGVGKTYTMLREVHTLQARGVDVVIGTVDGHGRPDTGRQTHGLEIIAPKFVEFQGRAFEEMDVDAIVARNPRVVVVDELAHSNVPGSRFSKRYMDIEYLLDHGIDVLTAVNIHHIEGIADEAEAITGIKVREIIPESFVKRAAEIEVIDVTPETLRQRLRDGSIYPMEQVDKALNNFFRTSNLAALRELVLREVADDVDERLQKSFDRRRIPGPVGAKEAILVCVNYLDRSGKLLEKAKRMADRLKADLLVLTIVNTALESMTAHEREHLAKLREMADNAEADYILESRNDRKLGQVIIDVADRYNVTQIVIGQPNTRQLWRMPWHENPVRYLLKHLKYVDLRIVGWREA